MTSVQIANNERSGRNWFWIVFCALLILSGGMEINRLLLIRDAGSPAFLWLSFWDMESTIPFALLILLLILVAAQKRCGPAHDESASADSNVVRSAAIRHTAAIAILVFCISLLCSYRIGSESISVKMRYESTELPFAALPPAYHDEYSYLLQAETFLDGRLTYPPAPTRPDLFHQFHVLNEHRTVSRYFPATGLWVAPFQYFGDPILGHWLAGALAAVFFFLSMLQICSFRAAAIAGFLIALSPGIAVFSNLLLAHHPTMLSLSVFTWSFLRMTKQPGLPWAFLSGTALTFAMLGRPMTAAGFALPFGVALLHRMIREPQLRLLAIGFAIPICIGFGILGMLNNAATGDWMRSPYQEYTDRFTPRHKYGFNNALDAGISEGPPALQAYDNWAQNLTGVVVLQNVWNRLFASFQWSLAILPLLFGVLLSFPVLISGCWPSGENVDVIGARLLAAAIFTMHLVHIPYWYDGIMHWHYVFETAPLLLMVATMGLVVGCQLLSRILPRSTAIAWFFLLICGGLLPGWVRLGVFDNNSKVGAAISEQSWSRVRFETFNQSIRSDRISKPALIMVNERDTDPQLSYIINPPNLDDEVLVCRLPESPEEVQGLHAIFGDRHFYVFEPDKFFFSRWNGVSKSPQQ